jgi:hypothetical protein
VALFPVLSFTENRSIIGGDEKENTVTKHLRFGPRNEPGAEFCAYQLTPFPEAQPSLRARLGDVSTD